MSAEALSWHDAFELEHRRRLRRSAGVSLALHVVLVLGLVLSPEASLPPMPEVLSVELVAAPPMAPAPPRARPAPKPPAAAPVEPPRPAPPPPPKAPVEVLPEEAPKAVAKPRPPAPEKARPKPAPAPTPADVRRKTRAEPESFDDVMAELDAEFGADDAREVLDRPKTPAPAPAPTGARRGVQVSPAMAAWTRATTRRIQSVWVTPANFRGRQLATHLRLDLSAQGKVLAAPEVVRSSGDPYFDDNAVRAVLTADPLPAPPRAGQTVFIFRSDTEGF